LTPAVVIAHGLWMTGAETLLLRHRLARRGFAPYLFRYHTVTAGLAENAAALARTIERVPERPVHIVGHSLGGVIALEAIDRFAPAGVGRIVCIGSPVRGSVTARRLAAMPWLARVVGRSMDDLNARGGLGSWRHAQVEVGIIAGTTAVGVGRALGAVGPASDGTVSVEETRLDGARDEIVRPFSHFGLLFSASVADDIARFLRHGHF
jgi:pimeloyl-ACP methyl ester carboxylesterase